MLTGLLLARLELKSEPSCDDWFRGNMGRLLGQIVQSNKNLGISKWYFINVFILREFPGGKGEGAW